MFLISDLIKLPEETVVEFRGIVHAVRDLKKYTFLVLEQEGCSVQVVCEKSENKVWNFSRFQHVEVTGSIKKSPKGEVEIHAIAAHLLGECNTSNLLDEKAGLETQLDERHISLRFKSSQSILRLSSLFEYALRQYWFENGYTEIHTPKIVEGATESGAEVFKLDYFGSSASLAQSPQFYKQLAVIGGFNRVFEVGSVFRAEPSFTSKHATDFTMIDVEIGGITSVSDVIDEEESLLLYAFKYLLSSDMVAQDIKEKLLQIISGPRFLRISHKDVIDILAKEYGHTINDDQDLDSAAEKMICDFSRKNGLGDFVFVTHYPAKVRAFYTMISDDGQTSESFDLLWSGVEITSGAQREHRLSFLLENLAQKSIDPTSISSYLKFFEASAPPHGGFGIGLARVISILCKQESIRTSSFVFRGPNRLVP